MPSCSIAANSSGRQVIADIDPRCDGDGWIENPAQRLPDQWPERWRLEESPRRRCPRPTMVTTRQPAPREPNAPSRAPTPNWCFEVCSRHSVPAPPGACLPPDQLLLLTSPAGERRVGPICWPSAVLGVMIDAGIIPASSMVPACMDKHCIHIFGGEPAPLHRPEGARRGWQGCTRGHGQESLSCARLVPESTPEKEQKHVDRAASSPALERIVRQGKRLDRIGQRFRQ